MPRKIRDSEPDRIGVPISNPNSVSEMPSSVLMRTPMIEKIVHTAKHTVKARVDIHKARPSALDIPSCIDGLLLKQPKKSCRPNPCAGAQQFERQLCLIGARHWAPEPFLTAAPIFGVAAILRNDLL
jgi:hypothetical protein